MTDAPEPAHPRRYGYALALIGVAGAVDAIGFLHFRTFYVSFMSGNTTRGPWRWPKATARLPSKAPRSSPASWPASSPAPGFGSA